MNLNGSLVRLGPVDLTEAPDVFARWRNDTEYLRLLGDPVLPMLAATIRRRSETFEPGNSYRFLIYTLDNNHLIGFISLWMSHADRDAWIGIGIGDAANRGKGYGTDAMRVVLRYIFEELEMDRASLGVFVDNVRAVRAYQRAGFVVEGRQREEVLRDGRRWDTLIMGILRRDWLAMAETPADGAMTLQ
jgi:RimJ/RimL family protein N-acetyltransferase